MQLKEHYVIYIYTVETHRAHLLMFLFTRSRCLFLQCILYLIYLSARSSCINQKKPCVCEHTWPIKLFLILFDCIFILLGETIPLMADGFINKLAFKGLGLVIYYVFETRMHLFDQNFCKNCNKSYTFLQFKIIYNNLFFIINYSQNSF